MFSVLLVAGIVTNIAIVCHRRTIDRIVTSLKRYLLIAVRKTNSKKIVVYMTVKLRNIFVRKVLTGRQIIQL